MTNLCKDVARLGTGSEMVPELVGKIWGCLSIDTQHLAEHAPILRDIMFARRMFEAKKPPLVSLQSISFAT